MAYKGKYVRPKPKKKRRRRSPGPKILLFLLLGLLLIGCAFGAYSLFSGNTPASNDNPQDINISMESFGTDPNISPSEIVETEPPPTEPPTEPAPVIYTASVGAMGDLLMHSPIFSQSYSAEVSNGDGTYNFDSLFQYLETDISALDYAAINLETTLAGTDNGYAYSGYPNFNCPDSLIASVKDAGFDMLLTANNHSYDTKMTGLKRTLSVSNEMGMDTIGTYATSDATKWTIKNINNINVGMLCYTYATDETPDGRPALNGAPPIAEAGLCNYFYPKNLTAFYEEVLQHLNEMEDAGMDVSIMYIHWGQEYQLVQNDEQQRIAQTLCDMGIDVIIGSHPHVVQPIELLQSKRNPNHRTVCLYSTGNAVSNQRLGNLSAVSTAHTEDGVLFSVTFEKEEGSDAKITAVNAIPTWVNMHTNDNNKREYNILPLHRSSVERWQEDFNLSAKAYVSAKDSFDRTMLIIGEGLAEVQDYLDNQESLVSGLTGQSQRLKARQTN